MEFNLFVARSMLVGGSRYVTKHCDGALWLSLDEFSTYTEEAIELLASRFGPVEGIEVGFSAMSARAILALKRLKPQFLHLGQLYELDIELATALGAWEFGSRPILSIETRMPISVTAATGLIGKPPAHGECDRPLTLSLPSLSVEVADVLKRQTHEFFLVIRDQELTPDVLRILTEHAGYSMTINSEPKFSDEALAVLESNPAKKSGISRRFQRVCVMDHDMWLSSTEDEYGPEQPQLDRETLRQYADVLEYTDAGTKPVLSLEIAKRLIGDGLILPSPHREADFRVFGALMPDAIRYLANFEFYRVILGVDFLDPWVAREVAQWPARIMIFDDNTVASAAALRALQGFRGELHVGDQQLSGN